MCECIHTHTVRHPKEALMLKGMPPAKKDSNTYTHTYDNISSEAKGGVDGDGHASCKEKLVGSGQEQRAGTGA